jgi:hypothetical protein
MSVHHQSHYPVPVSWHERLQLASTEVEVVELCRYFVAQLTLAELAHLPEACRPRKLVDGSDVTEFAFALVRHRCDDGLGAEYTAHRLSAFFGAAATRLSQILQAQYESGEASQPSA